MEEDIKIIEQFLMGNKCCEDCTEKCVDCYIEYEEVQAVARLIKGYRELEEENKKIIQGKFREVADKNSYIKDMYIPKSKIKEKIEEIQNKFEFVNGWDSEFNYAIEVLQELMEE